MADLESSSNQLEWSGYENWIVEKYNPENAYKLFNFCLGENMLPEQPSVKKGRISYMNIPCSFDIETTSFITYTSDGTEVKQATMYIWQLGINGSVIYGRTWDEFGECLGLLQTFTNADEYNRIIIYVHNLGYEFGFMGKLFDWDKVFSVKQRRPLQCISGCFEFRCSLLLSNAALKFVGKELLYKYPCQKLVGDLDYSLKRGTWTEITDKELGYCINDVRVVMCYIQQKIEEDGGIDKIPLTSTGYVRNYIRQACFGSNQLDKQAKEYHRYMKSLIINDEAEYYQMLRCFMGGFTHANILHANQVIEDVGSADLASSYPYHMLAEYYPITRFRFIGDITQDEDFEFYLKNYCCMFDVRILNIRPAVIFENPISTSRCDLKECSYKANNGRLISADGWISTSCTELDWDTITQYYEWDEIQVCNLRISTRGYLPKPIIESVLHFYEQKTTLKGVEEKHQIYMMMKNLLNSSYGMMVTAAIRDDLQFDNDKDWNKVKADAAIQLEKYNRSYNRFLFYPWGIWVTAHARHSLFKAITEFGEDYVYADTDSIKGINFKEHLAFFRQYNNECWMKLYRMCKTYGIDFQKTHPKNQYLGYWDIEKGYEKFKTCGAKRYLYQYEDGEINLTVSGLNKKMAIPYLLDKWGDNIWEIFGEGMYVPKEHTGKNTLTYIDTECRGAFTDYLGVRGEYHEMSAIYMEPQSYHMSMIEEYLNYIEGVRYIEL